MCLRTGGGKEGSSSEGIPIGSAAPRLYVLHCRRMPEGGENSISLFALALHRGLRCPNTPLPAAGIWLEEKFGRHGALLADEPSSRIIKINPPSCSIPSIAPLNPPSVHLIQHTTGRPLSDAALPIACCLPPSPDCLVLARGLAFRCRMGSVHAATTEAWNARDILVLRLS